MCCIWVASGKETFWSRTLRSWKIWTRQKSCSETQRQGGSHAKERRRIRYSENPPVLINTLQEQRSTSMFFKESRTGLKHQTNKRMTLKLETVSVVFLEIIFIVITFNQELNSTCQKRDHSRYHSNIDVVRRTNTTLDVLLESRIDVFWNVDGGRELSGPWTVFTQFTILHEKSLQMGTRGLGRDSQKFKQHPGPVYLWPEVWSSMSKSHRQKKGRHWAIEKKPKLDNARKIEWNLLHRSG